MKMRKFIYALAALLTCKSDGNGADVDSAVLGEWHLTSWSGDAPDGFDVYLEFLSDGGFNIWQQVETSTYEHYSGTFTASGGNMSGTYCDGTAWGSTYSYSVSGGTLTLTTATGTKGVYAKVAVPDEVRNSPASKSPSLSPGRRFL